MFTLKLPAQAKNQPLHECVKEAVVGAIDAGYFKPGERICSTKELSRQLSVSVVTAHRAMQELVSNGVLDRKQGLGTFVVDQQLRDSRQNRLSRIGLVFHRESMIGDYYHGQIMEGLRQAANLHNAEMTILHFDSELTDHHSAYIYVNPTESELAYFGSRIEKSTPCIVVAAPSKQSNVVSIDVDNCDISQQAVEHLYQMGHRKIFYVGGTNRLSNNHDRYVGFKRACESLGLEVISQNVYEASGSRLDRQEKISLSTIFASQNRPTAVFAAGYYFALDVYEIAMTIGLEMPRDLSVVGVDDPPSAMYLSPTLTTLRQPLVEVGHAALSGLMNCISNGKEGHTDRILRSELVIRQSSAPPRR
ncbi:LacI family DNA-binding transcriptional regulator [Poriferisphaera sp. WC338]|uniref:LacI family DNA-binding transcriptional regulator n=1 Tax=Poriferisphaera sp. WC338 TaxID=3425129 RepID=UPI003D81782D